MLSSKERQILDVLEPVAQEHGIEIVTVQIAGAKKSPTVRVFIDSENGVDFDLISSAQTWVENLMDDLDPFPGAYVLELSSPGVDRPLRTPSHFKRFVGQQARVTAKPIDGRGSWTGEIVAADDQTVTMVVDGISYCIPIEGIKRAQLIGTVNFKREER